MSRHPDGAADRQGDVPGAGGRGGDRHRRATPPPTASPRSRSSTSRCRSVVDPFKALEAGRAVLRPDKRARRQPHLALGGRRPGGDRPRVRRAPTSWSSRTSTSRASTSRRSRPAAASPTSTRSSGKLTVYMTTQAPHAIRTVFALVAGHSASRTRSAIISPDIGGGFGGKVPVYPGYVIAVAARC